MANKIKCNFNMLACHNYDANTGSINGIFNSIEFGENGIISFDLLTIINLVNKNYDTLTIFYCIYNVKKGVETAKIINKSVLRPRKGVTGSNGRLRETSMEIISNGIRRIMISNMKFTEKGDYEIRAYVFWDQEHLEITGKDVKEVEIDMLLKAEENLESVFNLEIT